jgi:hypothetical protein
MEKLWHHSGNPMHLAIVALGALLAIACLENSGSDDDATGGGIARCRAICVDSRDCPGADPSLDCTTYCYDLDRIIVAGACRTRFNTLLDCDETLENICTESDDCDAELSDYLSCINAYCDDHAEECADVFGT